MKKIKCNGVEFTYNDELKPGDLITTYLKGYYTFVKYEDRGRRIFPISSF